jgi:hypothetical protein
VGSAPHEPGDEDFIELVACGFEDDAAILLCSDGLSDMLTAIEIQRIVRLHAGDPGAVVEALVTAANAAGGKDNVTVVYAEGLKFPRSRAAVDDTLPLLLPAQESMAEPARGTSRGFFRRVIERRAVAFAAGVIAGIVVALLIAGSRDRTSEMPGSRRLVVGGDAPGHYRTITDALAKARARDVVLVEPGEYPEELLLTDDVDVIARVPGAAVLTALPGRQNWTSVLAVRGRGLVRGLRIAGSTEAPIHVGIRVSAGNIEIDDVALTGLIATGIDIRGDSSVLVRASRFERLSGMPLRIAAAATTDIRQNYFIAANAGQSPAIEVSDDSKSLFDGNLFVHFGEIVMPPSGLRDALLATSFVIPIVLNR